MRTTTRLLFVCLVVTSPAGCRTSGVSALQDTGIGPATVGADGLMPVDAMIARAQARTTAWPDQQTPWPESLQAMDSPACQDFVSYLVPPPVDDNSLDETKQALRTDGVMVIHHGVVVYKNTRGPYADGETTRLHPMWSASKSFTAAMLAALAYASAHPDDSPAGQLGAKIAAKLGHPLTLATKIGEIMSPQSLATLNSSPAFAALTVRQFLNMSPNLHWAEDYSGGSLTDSTIIHMLWVPGTKSGSAGNWGGALGMAAYAAKPRLDHADADQFDPEGPGNKYIYSSGNAVILMRALQDVYGQSDYDALPWTMLFDRIGMSHVAFERDPAGTYIGSSYVHTTLADMAKFGYALINGGYYEGKQIMDPSWVTEFRHVSPAQLLPATSEDYLLDEAAFYGMGFYLNADPATTGRQFSPSFYAKLQQSTQSSRFFPHAPTDLFMAAGHYGQNIIILPQQDLMLVRYSHDNEYFSKIDAMTAKMQACFLPH